MGKMSDLYLAIIQHHHFALQHTTRDPQLRRYLIDRIADDLDLSPGQVIDAAGTYLRSDGTGAPSDPNEPDDRPPAETAARPASTPYHHPGAQIHTSNQSIQSNHYYHALLHTLNPGLPPATVLYILSLTALIEHQTTTTAWDIYDQLERDLASHRPEHTT